MDEHEELVGRESDLASFPVAVESQLCHRLGPAAHVHAHYVARPLGIAALCGRCGSGKKKLNTDVYDMQCNGNGY